MRVAQMGSMRQVGKRRNYQVKVDIPERLWPLFDGAQTLVRSTRTSDHALANRIALPILAEFHDRIAAAEARLGERQPRIPVAKKPWRELECYDPDRDETTTLFALGRYGPPGAVIEPVAKVSPIKVAGCSTETALNLWKVKRVNNPPGQKALNTKRSRMRDLFAHLNIADDLTLPTDEQLQSYKEHLLNLGGNALCFDHFTHICALYRVADQNNKFRGLPGGNPCAKISLPPKPDGLRRLSLSDAETKKILLAAREHNDPVVKWGELLMAALGLIVKEISEARVGHVRSVGGTVCLEITAKNRREIVDGVEQASKQLKTQFRTPIVADTGVGAR